MRYKEIFLLEGSLLAIYPINDEIESVPLSRLPALDVYSLCPDDDLNMHHIARMELPNANWEGMRSVLGDQGYSLQPRGVSLRFARSDHQEVILPFTGATKNTPGVFEVPETARTVQLIASILTETNRSIRSSHLPADYSITFPAKVVFGIQEACQGPLVTSPMKAGARLIPWAEWGHETRWLLPGFGGRMTQAGPILDPHSTPVQIFGGSCYDGRAPEDQLQGAIPVLELHPGPRAYSQLDRDWEKTTAVTENIWKKGLQLCRESTINDWPIYVLDNKIHIDSNYLMAEFKHEIIDQLRLAPPPVVVWADDEHSKR
jgi:hypothetical protein